MDIKEIKETQIHLINKIDAVNKYYANILSKEIIKNGEKTNISDKKKNKSVNVGKQKSNVQRRKKKLP